MISPETLSEELEFTWKIKNFSMYPHKPGKAIKSPLLSVGNPRHSIFYLKMYPRGWDKSSKHIVAADLIRKEGSFMGQLVCKVSIEACDGSILEGQISTNCRSIIWNKNVGAIHFGRRLLVQEDFIENFLPNDTLIVRCKLVIHSVPRYFASDLIAFSQRIYSLYESKAHSDLTLCTKDKEFLVHKFILNQRAPNFFKDLGLQINNLRHECVKVNEISTPVLQSLIQYLYSGKLEVPPPANISEILEIAKTYGINTQNFVELTDEIITLGPPSIISTDIKVLTKEINWCILHENNADNLVQSICFGPIKFLIKLNFNLVKANISFQCLSVLEKDIFLGCKIYEGNKNSQNWASIEYQKLQFSVNGEGTQLHLPSQHLQKYSRNESPLTLQLLISVSNCQEILSIDSLTFVTPELPSHFGLSALHNDMISMFNKTQINGDGSDVRLNVVNRNIVAHKAILSTCSPVFEGMLNCDMEEKNNDKVDISDVDFETALRLVRFMYCGYIIKLSFIEDTKLYVAVVKYKVFSLFTRCSAFLESHLVPSNVCTILELAYKHSDDLLLASARKYFFSNQEAVKSSSAWRIFSDSNPHFSSMIQETV